MGSGGVPGNHSVGYISSLLSRVFKEKRNSLHARASTSSLARRRTRETQPQHEASSQTDDAITTGTPSGRAYRVARKEESSPEQRRKALLLSSAEEGQQDLADRRAQPPGPQEKGESLSSDAQALLTRPHCLSESEAVNEITAALVASTKASMMTSSSLTNALLGYAWNVKKRGSSQSRS